MVDLTNPKDLIGQTKVPMSQLPEVAQVEAALAMYEGSLKYGFRNYRYAPVRASVYVDAIRRHLCKWESGQDHDPASHVHHLGNVMACAAILMDAAAHQSLIDDRDQTEVGADYIDAAKAVVRNLQRLYGTDTRLLPDRDNEPS